MIVTVTRSVPQNVAVSPPIFQPTPTVTAIKPATATVGLVGIPGPEGPPGPPGTIVHVGPTPPVSPNVNDLWVDTS